jgi:hypothetical protein
MILLLQPPRYWDYDPTSPYLAQEPVFVFILAVLGARTQVFYHLSHSTSMNQSAFLKTSLENSNLKIAPGGSKVQFCPFLKLGFGRKVRQLATPWSHRETPQTGVVADPYQHVHPAATGLPSGLLQAHRPHPLQLASADSISLMVHVPGALASSSMGQQNGSQLTVHISQLLCLDHIFSCLKSQGRGLGRRVETVLYEHSVIGPTLFWHGVPWVFW